MSNAVSDANVNMNENRHGGFFNGASHPSFAPNWTPALSLSFFVQALSSRLLVYFTHPLSFQLQMDEARDDTSILDSELIDGFQKFLHLKERERLISILLESDTSVYYSLLVEISDVLDFNPSLGHRLYHQPRRFLPYFDDAAVLAQEGLLENDTRKPLMILKDRIHVRLLIHGSAMDCAELKPAIACLGVYHENKLITLRGTIIRAAPVQMLEGTREYECNKCKFRFKVSPLIEHRNSIQLPDRCPSKRSKPCKGINYKIVEDSKICCDYQEIKIQENIQALSVGSCPRTLTVILEDDLVDTVAAGDDVMITGYLVCKWHSVALDSRCKIEHVFYANFIKKINEKNSVVEITENTVKQFEEYWKQYEKNPMKGRNEILKCICPQIFGLFTVKLAVALTVIGGLQRIDDSGTRIRGECHLLLVGDPGTGKSQFLKYASKLSTHSILTTGLGSSNAGLTVAAIKCDGQWMLEAGALVLADGGLCCIDEFSSISNSDKTSILEAMEQQTISVAKAGLVTTLSCKTSVFAVTNPKGHYDPDQSIAVNTAIGSALLSRFDCVLVLRDTKNSHWDKVVSSHILSEHTDKEVNEEKEVNILWSLPMLQSYFQYVKENFHPLVSKEAEEIMMAYYQFMRKIVTANVARVSIRMLESLIRLAQAHARLMFSNTVTKRDAIVAVMLMECSMSFEAFLLPLHSSSPLHSDFSSDPDSQYSELEMLIMQKLGLFQCLDQRDEENMMIVHSQKKRESEAIQWKTNSYASRIIKSSGHNPQQHQDSYSVRFQKKGTLSSLSWLQRCEEGKQDDENDSDKGNHNAHEEAALITDDLGVENNLNSFFGHGGDFNPEVDNSGVDQTPHAQASNNGATVHPPTASHPFSCSSVFLNGKKRRMSALENDLHDFRSPAHRYQTLETLDDPEQNNAKRKERMTRDERTEGTDVSVCEARKNGSYLQNQARKDADSVFHKSYDAVKTIKNNDSKFIGTINDRNNDTNNNTNSDDKDNYNDDAFDAWDALSIEKLVNSCGQHNL